MFPFVTALVLVLRLLACCFFSTTRALLFPVVCAEVAEASELGRLVEREAPAVPAAVVELDADREEEEPEAAHDGVPTSFVVLVVPTTLVPVTFIVVVTIVAVVHAAFSVSAVVVVDSSTLRRVQVVQVVTDDRVSDVRRVDA